MGLKSEIEGSSAHLFRKKGRPLHEILPIEHTDIDEATELLPSLSAHVNDLKSFICNEIALDKHHIYPMYSACK